MPLPIPPGVIWGIILNCVGDKDKIVILVDSLQRLPFLFYVFPYHLGFQIIIWNFPVYDNLVKISHLESILVSRVESVVGIGEIH